MGDPIEGQILLLTAATASVPPSTLPALVDRVQADLEPRVAQYRREYECVHDADGRCGFFAERGHWDALGERLDLSRRETDAVRRAHEEQLLRVGRREGRAAEFESALEIRDPVMIATA